MAEGARQRAQALEEQAAQLRTQLSREDASASAAPATRASGEGEREGRSSSSRASSAEALDGEGGAARRLVPGGSGSDGSSDEEQGERHGARGGGARQGEGAAAEVHALRQQQRRVYAELKAARDQARALLSMHASTPLYQTVGAGMLRIISLACIVNVHGRYKATQVWGQSRYSAQ